MKKQYLLSLLCCLSICGCGDDSNENKVEVSKNKPECSQDKDCDSGKCLGSGKCAKLADAGENCNSNVVCREGLLCNDGICEEPPKDEGCTGDDDCDDGEVCSEGECVSVTILAKGDACDSTSKTAVCSEGLICYQNKCMSKDEAEKCQSDSDCSDEADEHTTCLESGLCGAVRAKGGKCGGDIDVCEEGLECAENVCIQRVDDGEACAPDEWVSCAVDHFCVEGICQSEPKQEPQDPGPSEEKQPDTDDSDVINDDVKLPSGKPLPNDPCLSCGFDQECINGQCVGSTRHYVVFHKFFSAENGDVITGSFSIPPFPAKDVKVECSILTDSPYPEAKIDCSQIVIPAGDVLSEGVVQPGKTYGDLTWQTNPKPFTVTGIPDDVDDDVQKYTVLMKTVSEDPTYNNVIHSPIHLTSRNVDTAGVVVAADHVLQTGESGSSTTYTLALSSKPPVPVKLKLRSSDVTEGTVEPKTIVFTADNWKVPQTVTVTGVDDEYRDGAVDYSIYTTVVSKDPKYNGLDVPKVRVTNVDNDAAGISIAKEGYKLTPSSTSMKAGVTLNMKPTQAVTVHLGATYNSDLKMLSFMPETLEFTPENWDQPQTVELVAGNFENAKTAITAVCLNASVEATEDEAYQGVMSNVTCLDIYRYPTLNFAYKGAEEKVSLVPGEYTLEVWGCQGEGSVNARGGFGGYSHGEIEFKETTDVYVNVGGVTYNGGGNGQARGGGATHLALVSGLLSTLSEQRGKVLLVAGGGGGGERNAGGYGGGTEAGDGSTYGSSTLKIPTGAKGDAGGSFGSAKVFGNGTDGTFGQGGDGLGVMGTQDPATIHEHMDYGGAGGGGWFGGGGIPYAGGGGGGTGHVGEAMNKGETLAGSGDHSFPSPSGGTEIGHVGDGYARISIIERPDPIVVN